MGTLETVLFVIATLALAYLAASVIFLGLVVWATRRGASLADGAWLGALILAAAVWWGAVVVFSAFWRTK